MLTYFYYPGDTFGISYDGFRILNISNDETGVFQTQTMVLDYVDLDTSKLSINARLLNNMNEYWIQKEEPLGTLIPFEYELAASNGQDSISLTVVSVKPPLIPGGDGLLNQGTDSYTYYYSLTGNKVEGTLTYEGNSEAVTGSAWIDRQYGSFNPNIGERYEWFFLQLSNGMDLNIWNLFTPDNQQPRAPEYRHMSVYVDTASQYTTSYFELERLAWVTSPVSGNSYSQEWRLTSVTNQLDLHFATIHHNAEVALPFYFFEGSTSATGTVNGEPVTGIGFAELVKNYEAPELKITQPGSRWNEDIPVGWKVMNPDDGRPLLFDLKYSTTGEEPWNPIITGLEDTIYFWTDHSFANGDSCWFRIDGFTADKTLQGTAVSSEATLYDDLFNSTLQEKDPVSIVYPNPTGNILRFEWLKDPDQKGTLSYQILDALGREVLQGNLKNEVDVESLGKGVYMLILQAPSGTICHAFIKN